MQDVNKYFDQLDKWKSEVLILREILLRTGLSETIKWGHPCYVWHKDNVVGLAPFKNYVGLWFFQGGLLEDKQNYLINAQENKTRAMLQWRFYSKEDILHAPIEAYIIESIENIKQGIKIKPKTKSDVIIIPNELDAVLSENADLKAGWTSLSVSCKREFAEYISEAKREATRLSRLAKIIPMILEKNGLHDKYKK